MNNTFWRVAYDKDQLAAILDSRSISLPDLGRWPQAKNNSPEKILAGLREGDVLLLANFDRSSEIGIVRGVGCILKVDGLDTEVHWKSLYPVGG
jgi:hypothetical protein